MKVFGIILILINLISQIITLCHLVFSSINSSTSKMFRLKLYTFNFVKNNKVLLFFHVIYIAFRMIF